MRKATAAERDLVRRLTDGVEGFLSDDEALYLLRLAADGRGDGAIVEIGSYHGRSTAVLAHGSRAAGREKVVAVDPHLGGAVDAFHATLARAGVADHVRPIVATSDDAASTWRGPIRLLWIDGSHVDDQVRRDFRNWLPHVVAGGIVAFHDSYEYDGVRRVIDEEVVRTRDLVLVGLVDTIAAFRREPGVGLAARLRRNLMRAGRKLYSRRGYVRVKGTLRKTLKRLLRRVSQTS
jgi:predicted O-methyltransferase YrrM